MNGTATLRLELFINDLRASHADLDEGHPIRRAAHERAGRGVEIVLEVDDLEATYQQVVSEEWPRSAEMRRRPWGLTDFRVLDPDGYYWRVTSRKVTSREETGRER